MDIQKLSKILFPKRFVNLVYIKPYIIYTQHSFFRDYAINNTCLYDEFFTTNECYLLSTDNWYWNDNKYRITQLKLIIEGYNKFKIRYPKTKIIFLCPDKDTFNGYTSYNIPCFIFNRNALLDYNDYFIYNDNKKYDSIYNANLYKYKRHELILNINNLGLIYYLRNDKNKIYYINDDEIEYGKNLENKLSKLNNITLLNKQNGYYKYLTKDEICKYYGQTYSGLILSDIEGICLVSMEYLLSGLPVISTKNKGGRDYFLENEEFSITNINDTDIQYYINYYKEKNIDSKNIRNTTINKIDKHRKEFLLFIKDYIYTNISYSFIDNMILAQKNYKP